MKRPFGLILCIWVGMLSLPATAQPWRRHVIDDRFAGADGVRLADVNRDGRLDITTGWEEGGVTRVYLHPGYEKAAAPWPSVTVGNTPHVEDAVFCDVDRDGAVDVLSSCEGTQQCLFVHWAPHRETDYMNPAAWKTRAIPVTRSKTQWMFASPLHINDKPGTELVVGSKNRNGMVGWLEAPPNPRDMENWTLRTLYRAGWIMSIQTVDMDSDGDDDLLISDRRGENAGVLWLENPGVDNPCTQWPEHRIGADGREVMFLDIADLDTDGRRDIVVAVRPDEIHCFRSPPEPRHPWPCRVIKVIHPAGLGTAKAARISDLDRDGKPDIVYSCEQAESPRRGIVWLRGIDLTAASPDTQDISGSEGIKFDRLELQDMDGDGDLDVLTCEERHQNRGLGIIWYENPFSAGIPSRIREP